MSIIQEPWSILYVDGAGPRGDKGEDSTVPGPAGPQGPAGEGVPIGGTTGQVLAKASVNDYDTQWVDQGSIGAVAWDDVTGKPTLGTAAATAATDYATAAQGALADSALQPGDAVPYADLSGVPSTFPPDAHGHAIADVTGLQTSLDGKQPLATVLTNTTAAFTAAQESKLAGIAAGATANATDAQLRDRATHTGTQTAATISDFAAAVAATPAVAANTAKVSNATHTGDVTGATALTIANNAVTNAKAADMATATIKGRATAGTGDPEDLTAAQVRTLLNVADGAQANVPTDLSYTAATRLLASSTGADVNLPIFTGTEAGLVPASGGGTANFLRADGTFAAPGGGGGGSPGGTDAQVQFNDGGVFAGATGWTWNKTTNTATLASGTQTANNPAQTITQTWNNAGATFTGLRLNVTDTASNAASLLANFELGGLSRFSVDKNGAVVANRSISFVENIALTTPPATGIGNYFGALGIYSGGTRIAIASSTGLRIDNGGLHFSNAEDVSIFKDAADTLAQRRGTNPQTSRIYGSFTDAGNHRRLSLGMSTAGVARIAPEGAGTGASGNVLHISGLPTANPGPGILWNDAGTVKVGT